MTTNIVCSDTYIDAFSRLDKKTQKKSLETIRLMQRSLRSDSLKIEKLNTKLDFKSARVTQDFRVIFTQSGNTVLLVYIDHHDDAYLWASNRLQGFDATNIKPAYEYFEQSQKDTFDSLEDESIDFTSNKKTIEPAKKAKTDKSSDASGMQINNQVLGNYAPPQTQKNPLWESFKKLLFALFFTILGFVVGIITTAQFFL